MNLITVLVLCFGIVLSLGIPSFANAMLKSKQKQIASYWDASYKNLQEWKRTHDMLPSSSAKGKEGALGIWVEGQSIAAHCGHLSSGQLGRLEKAGFKFAGGIGNCDDLEQRFSFAPRPSIRIAIPIFFTLVELAVVSLVPASDPHLLAYLFFAFTACSTAALATIIDLRVRIIPWELCLAATASGIAYQFICHGPATALVSTAFAAATLALISFSERIANRTGLIGSIGGGDIRFLAPCVLFGGIPFGLFEGSVAAAGAAIGLFCMCVPYVLYTAVGLLSKRFTLKTYQPYAPWLSVWLVSGYIVSCALA
jgi:prepilin signal peptidase PulO-like enzyme (type II secretory pathway)